MIFRVTLKDPDTLHDAITEAVALTLPGDMASDEADAIREVREEKCKKICNRWFEYGEYLTVEVDTDEKTCVVVEPGRSAI